MTNEETVALRKQLGFTQSEMASELGLNVRSWQDVESGATRLKKVHWLALEAVALARAVDV